MIANKIPCHSRESGIAKTGVGANIGVADGQNGELHDAVRNPVKIFLHLSSEFPAEEVCVMRISDMVTF